MRYLCATVPDSHDTGARKAAAAVRAFYLCGLDQAAIRMVALHAAVPRLPQPEERQP